MPSLSWYIRRASAMSAPELFHRAWFVQQKCRWKRRRGRNRPQRMLRTPDDDDAPDGHQTLRDHPGAHELLREADRYLDHQWLFFGADELREQNIDWHGDPVSGISAPLEFGFDINHRDEDAVGNIKVTWEKNRHHHLTVLAAAFAVTRNETYADEVWRQLTSWISDNPFPMGVNWTHPLEQGIRLIAWVWCERFLRGSKRHGELFGARGALWESIYDHQDFIARTYSRGSSANNHVIGEMAGLYAACSAWPYFRRVPGPGALHGRGPATRDRLRRESAAIWRQRRGNGDSTAKSARSSGRMAARAGNSPRRRSGPVTHGPAPRHRPDGIQVLSEDGPSRKGGHRRIRGRRNLHSHIATINTGRNFRRSGCRATRISIHRGSRPRRCIVLHAVRCRNPIPGGPGNVCVPHAASMAKLLPKYTGSQHGDRRREGPIGAGGRFSLEAQGEHSGHILVGRRGDLYTHRAS